MLEALRVVVYDLFLWFFNIIVHTFFRDIQSRGTFHIPKRGAVIFAVAPHHNQFVDLVVVMSMVRSSAKRRISYLIAAKSYRLWFIGTMARIMGSIPVERAQDLLKQREGVIRVSTWDEPREIEGEGTQFTKDCMVKGLVGLPESLGSAQVEEVLSDTRLRLKKPLVEKGEKLLGKDQRKVKLLSEGTSYKSAPHIDNHQVFDNVFNHLIGQKVLGIFPEGGSHDRPDLLPLKPGVAIMALGAASKSENPNECINIIPVGLNYFHPHKFRSRVVVEFGKPLQVTKEDAARYESDNRKEVSSLLEKITLLLKEVTVTCDDYDTVMALQAARRLYTSQSRENIPLPLVVEMNRRLLKGYEAHSDNPDVIAMKQAVSDYNSKIRLLGLHDHQIETLDNINRWRVLRMFVVQLVKVCVFFVLCLPGTIMFSPVFVLARHISRRKAREALAGLAVKIKAKDVLGTWKILVAMGVAPMLYIFWLVCGTWLVKLQGVRYPLWMVFVVFYSWLVLTTYASLRIGETGIDYYKQLKPLVYALLLYHVDLKIEELKETRRTLSRQVTEFCDKYGPSMFDDYDEFYRQYQGDDDYEYSDVFYGDHSRGSLGEWAAEQWAQSAKPNLRPAKVQNTSEGTHRVEGLTENTIDAKNTSATTGQEAKTQVLVSGHGSGGSGHASSSTANAADGSGLRLRSGTGS